MDTPVSHGCRITTNSGPFTHPSFLHTLRYHDDVADAVLPHHPPEVVLGAGQRALGGDVLPAGAVALDRCPGVSVCVRVHVSVRVCVHVQVCSWH